MQELVRPSDATLQAREGDRRRGIDRVIMLLEALLRHRAPMRAGDIARMINAPRSTTYEIVNRLLEAEMLVNVGEEGHVYFGPAMHLYGYAYAQQNALFRHIGEVMEKLALEADATAQLCTLHGNKYVVLDCRHGSSPFRISSDIGVAVPIPWTASGRLLLSHLDEAAIFALIPEEDFRLPDGRWLPRAEFLADIARAKQQGYCETAGLADRFTCCMAAPIWDGDGKISMTLCLVVPVDTPADRRAALLALLRDRTAKLSMPGPLAAMR
jgi:DNA-binding IclR family transcriptional regulator